MPVKKIISLIDFTGVTQLALEHVAIIARQSICLVTLLHIADESKRNNEKELKAQIREFASHLDKEGISFSIQIDYGNFFEVIADSIKKINSDFIVIGTHGIKGIKQNFVSTNIVKLIRLISTPAFIIQGHSQPPQEGYSNILIPMLERANTKIIEHPVEMFASMFKSRLHLLGFYTNENEKAFSIKTIDQADRFQALGFETQIQMEETSIYTSSFSKSIIQYADIEDIEVLVLAFHESDGMKDFDQVDLENILLNRLGKPVLCI
jgi:nucleotide-binding universal stress UspA family protein